MKQNNQIISLIVVVALLTSMSPTLAQEEEMSMLEQTCLPKAPQFYVETEEERKVGEKWQWSDAFPYPDYQKKLEEAKEAYHGYIDCLFETVEDSVYKKRQGGIVKANTPNTNVIDWMVPDQACLPQNEINKIIKETQPAVLLGPVLDTHRDYQNYLIDILKAYSNSHIETNEAGEEITGTDKFLTRTNNLIRLENETQMEIESAKVAIDIALSSMKELRSAFVMHVHFQCTLKYLEKYRKNLEKLRNLVDPLPDQLQDASISK